MNQFRSLLLLTPGFFSRISFADFSNLVRRLSSIHSSELDFSYLCDPKNFDEIMENIKRRKGPGDLKAVTQLYHLEKNSDIKDKLRCKHSLIAEALKIPNRCHPESFALQDEPRVVNELGEKKKFDHTPFTFEEISRVMNLTKTDNITNLTGPRSYYLFDHLVTLEQTLIQYTISYLTKLGFQLISVPDIVPREIVEACGMNTTGERTQVYSLRKDMYGKDLCLSGTAEIGIASMLANKSFKAAELPKRYVAVSRCFRAETSKIAEEKGIYRVHSFTKVEMFAVTSEADSAALLEEFVSLEESLFSRWGLCLRTLEMPPEELGPQAYRKFDVEAWLPGRSTWAELSSASDCTDYQARRLNLRVTETGRHCHTVNGTGLAVPRLLMALLETHQQPDSSVLLPPPLPPLSPSRLPPLKPLKHTDKRLPRHPQPR